MPKELLAFDYMYITHLIPPIIYQTDYNVRLNLSLQLLLLFLLQTMKPNHQTQLELYTQYFLHFRLI